MAVVQKRGDSGFLWDYSIRDGEKWVDLRYFLGGRKGRTWWIGRRDERGRKSRMMADSWTEQLDGGAKCIAMLREFVVNIHNPLPRFYNEQCAVLALSQFYPSLSPSICPSYFWFRNKSVFQSKLQTSVHFTPTHFSWNPKHYRVQYLFTALFFTR